MKVPEPRKLKSGTLFIQMRLGGWADNQTMRKIYTHIADADKAKAENAMTNFFENAN